MWWSITLVAFGSWPRLHVRPARCPCLQVVQDKAKRTQQGNLLGHLGEDDGGHLGHIGVDVYSHAQWQGHGHIGQGDSWHELRLPGHEYASHG